MELSFCRTHPTLMLPLYCHTHLMRSQVWRGVLYIAPSPPPQIRDSFPGFLPPSLETFTSQVQGLFKPITSALGPLQFSERQECLPQIPAEHHGCLAQPFSSSLPLMLLLTPDVGFWPGHKQQYPLRLEPIWWMWWWQCLKATGSPSWDAWSSTSNSKNCGYIM